MHQLAESCILDQAHYTLAPFNVVTGRALDYFEITLPDPHAYDVASSIGVSPGHLANLFRTDLGMTPRQFVARVRIEITKHLLRDTDMKLEPSQIWLDFMMHRISREFSNAM